MTTFERVSPFAFVSLNAMMQAVPQEEPGSSYLEATPRGRGSTSRPRDAAGGKCRVHFCNPKIRAGKCEREIHGIHARKPRYFQSATSLA